MNVRIRLFAVARELAGCDEIELHLPAPATVGSLRAKIAEEYPALAAILPHILFAIGSEYARDDSVIPEGSEVACIPPVSGG